MNNELFALTAVLTLIDDIQGQIGCHIDFSSSNKVAYTTSGKYLKKIAEAAGQEIRETQTSFTDCDGNQAEHTYYEIEVNGWTLHTLQDPENATY
jgi:hypothetical protein